MDEEITIVIFGGSGDLSRRKLVPALFSLSMRGRLSSRAHVVGFANEPSTTH